MTGRRVMCPEREDRWRTSLLVPAVIVAIAVAFIGGIVLLSRQEQDEGGAALAATTVDPDTLPVTVPYRDLAGAIVVDVQLGRDGAVVPMLLDSGAPTIVTDAIAETYAGEPVGTLAATSADGQVVTSDVVTLPQLAIGGAVFRDVGAVVGAIEPGNPFSCLTDAGFVGASLMRTGVWQIDPVARTVTIAASTEGLDHVSDAPSFGFGVASDISPSPLIELPAGEGRLTVLLDTGSDGWLAVHPADLEAVGIELGGDAPTMSLLATGAAGPFTAEVRWAAAELGLPGAEGATPVATTEVLPERQGNAGTDLLWRYVVTIDWPGRVVYLDPVAPPMPTTPVSASLAWDDGYVVGSYVAGVPGAEALQLGLGVSAIDGEDVTGVPFADYCARLLAGEVGSTLTLADEAATTIEVSPADGFLEAFER